MQVMDIGNKHLKRVIKITREDLKDQVGEPRHHKEESSSLGRRHKEEQVKWSKTSTVSYHHTVR
jgi:hypothetical protein